MDIFADIRLILSKLRGDAGVSWKAALQALLRLLSRATDVLPEANVSAAMTEMPLSARAPTLAAQAAADEQHLEFALSANSEAAVDWTVLLPVLLDLLARWLGRR